jgi:putative glycosyltransferase
VKLSIVATLYRSSSYLDEFHRRATAAAASLVGDDYEIVLVNDGSPDDSLERAIELSARDPHVAVVDLSRNFGHHKAMVAGLEHADGELLFLLDSDLEEEPEWLPEFHRSLLAERADVVYGRQQERKGGFVERWSGEAYYTLFNWLSNIEHPRNIVTARLMTRRYVDALLQYRERELVISCLWVIAGFKQVERLVRKHSSSRTTYSLTRRAALAAGAITSFSEVPLKLIFYVGVLVFAAALVYASYLVALRFYAAQALDGWTSVMVSVWLLGGMIISFVGVVGMYLSKVFVETKQRPLTIVREIHGKKAGDRRSLRAALR